MSLPASNGKIVLISGINGYIASVLGLELLRKGYTVRGTSRSAAAKEHLLSDAYKGYEDRYEHFTVADITEKGAFDEAAKGVHYVLHTASPVNFSLKTVDDFLHPAVNGNISILNSTLSAGPQLEIFVLTSSIAAIVDILKPMDYHFTEDDWNVNGETAARKEFAPGLAYGSSKAAAERAMWHWKELHKPSFAMAAVNPGVVTGPPISWPAVPAKLNETLKPTWNIFSGEAMAIPPGIGGQSYIDVRDVAALHIWAMEHPADSNGQRYLATNGKGTTQAIADILRKAYPEREIVVGEPESNYIPRTFDFPEGERTYRATKAYKAMGVKHFRGFEESILDTAKAFEQRWPGLAKNYKK